MNVGFPRSISESATRVPSSSSVAYSDIPSYYSIQDYTQEHRVWIVGGTYKVQLDNQSILVVRLSSEYENTFIATIQTRSLLYQVTGTERWNLWTIRRCGYNYDVYFNGRILEPFVSSVLSVVNDDSSPLNRVSEIRWWKFARSNEDILGTAYSCPLVSDMIVSYLDCTTNPPTEMLKDTAQNWSIENATFACYTGALAFDGTQTIRLPAPTILQDEEFSISCWFYVKSADAQKFQTLFAFTDGEGNSAAAYFNSQNFKFYSSYGTLNHSDSFGEGWYFLTISSYLGCLSLYINGDLKIENNTKGTYASQIVIPPEWLYIGGLWFLASENIFEGALNDLSFLTVGLSAGQVLERYTNGSFDVSDAQSSYNFGQNPIADVVSLKTISLLPQSNLIETQVSANSLKQSFPYTRTLVRRSKICDDYRIVRERKFRTNDNLPGLLKIIDEAIATAISALGVPAKTGGDYGLAVSLRIVSNPMLLNATSSFSSEISITTDPSSVLRNYINKIIATGGMELISALISNLNRTNVVIVASTLLPQNISNTFHWALTGFVNSLNALISTCKAYVAGEKIKEILSLRMYLAGRGDSYLIQHTMFNNDQDLSMVSILVDGGGRGSREINFNQTILPSLPGYLNYVCVTHVDADHIEGIIKLFQLMKEEKLDGCQFHYVGKLWFNIPGGSTQSCIEAIEEMSGMYEDQLQKQARGEPILEDFYDIIRSWKQGSTLASLAEDLSIPIVSINSDTASFSIGSYTLNYTGPLQALVDFYNDSKGQGTYKAEYVNRTSIIFTINQTVSTSSPTNLIMTGDAFDREVDDNEIPGRKEVDIRRVTSSASFLIMKVPHHGSKHSNDDQYYINYLAKAYLISGGSSGHNLPNFEALQNILNANRNFMNTGYTIYVNRHSGGMNKLIDDFPSHGDYSAKVLSAGSYFMDFKIIDNILTPPGMYIEDYTT